MVHSHNRLQLECRTVKGCPFYQMWDKCCLGQAKGKWEYIVIVARIIIWLFFLDTVYEFSSAAITKYQNLGSLKERKFLLSHFCRPEVWNQGVSRAMLPLRFWVESWILPCLCLPSGGGCHFSVLLGLRLHHSSLCLCCHMVFFLSSHRFSLLIRIPVIMDKSPL